MRASPDLEALIRLVLPWIAAAALAIARASGILIVFPLFTRTGLVGLLRGGVAMALAAPMIPVVLDNLSAGDPLGPLGISALAFKELLVGLVLGLALGVPFWAAEAAGSILDYQRGSTAGVMIDPSSLSQAPVTGTFFVLVLLMIFVMAGGIGTLADTLYRSYAAWPPRAFLPRFDEGAMRWALALLDQVTRLALLLASPIVIAMFLGDLSLAFVARFAPQLNVFDLSMALKNILFVLLLPIYLVFLIDHLRQALAPLPAVVPTLEGILK